MKPCPRSSSFVPNLPLPASPPALFPPTLIRSPRHLADALRALVESRAERDRAGLLVCDGLRFVERVARSPNFRPVLFAYAPELLRSQPFGDRLLALLKEHHSNIPLVRIAPGALAFLSQSPEPQGIVAVARQAWTPIPRLPPDAGLCYVALDTVRSAGNLGTVLRTLEAVGGAGLICLPTEPTTNTPPDERVDPFAPGAVRAAMGSTFALRFARPSAAEWECWRAKHGVLLVGTSPHTGVDYRTVCYGERAVLWMGGERTGLSEAQMAQCDRLVRIPMAPGATADSLNLATATSVLLYEVFNQRSPIP